MVLGSEFRLTPHPQPLAPEGERGGRLDRGGTKQLYGVGPTSVPRRRRLWRSARRGAPETSPCHVRAKQNGELDPQAVSVASAAVLASAGRPGSAASRAARGVGDGSGDASAQLGIHSARGQPREDSCICQKPRATAGGQSKVDEVEHPAHMSPCGILSQILARFLRSLVVPQFGRAARHAGPRLVQLLSSIVCPHSFVSTARAWMPRFVELAGCQPDHRDSSRALRVNCRKTAWRRTAAACDTGDRRYGRSWLRGPIRPSSCHACVPGVPAISWHPARPAASDTPLH